MENEIDCGFVLRNILTGYKISVSKKYIRTVENPLFKPEDTEHTTLHAEPKDKAMAFKEEWLSLTKDIDYHSNKLGEFNKL